MHVSLYGSLIVKAECYKHPTDTSIPPVIHVNFENDKGDAAGCISMSVAQASDLMLGLQKALVESGEPTASAA